MSAPVPITPAEAADLLRRTVAAIIHPDAVPDGWDGTGFVFTTPATGQRFRVEVTELAQVTP